MMSEKELESLRFSCIQCGECCKGGRGFVLLTQEDLERLAYYFDKKPEDFINEDTMTVSLKGEKYLSLKEKLDYQCIYLENNQCSVYPARPFQCRVYPYWERIISSLESWEKEKKDCRGIGKGGKINLEEAAEWIIASRNKVYLKEENR